MSTGGRHLLTRGKRVAAALGRRGIASMLVLVAVSLLLFALVELRPAPPPPGSLCDIGADLQVAAAVCEHWACDSSLPVRAATAVGNLLLLDLGPAQSHDQPVAGILGEALPHELALLGSALVGAALFLRLGRWMGPRAAGLVCALPTWVLGVVFAELHGREHAGALLPGLGVGLVYGAAVTWTRGASDEPVERLLVDKLPSLLSALVMEEILLNRAGLGRVVLGAAFAEDTPLLVGCVYTFAVLCVGARFLADLPSILRA
jgi:ABC-type dipeptide/oligopeptide/nickel transport system permease component